VKDRDWFLEQLDKVIVKCGSVSMLKTEKGAEALQRIYDQGRADQNEADVKAFVVAGRKHHEFIHPDIAVDLYGAILAAGPEVKE
jgi:hypothetical protein